MTSAARRRVLLAGGQVGPFGRQPERSMAELSRPVVADALADAGIDARAVECAFVGNGFGGMIHGQETILGQTLLAPCGLEGIPVHNVKNACSSGSAAFALAWNAVAFGQHECVLVLGVEKMTHPERGRTLAALASATDRVPESDQRSVFMDVQAQRARAYMALHGASERDFALCAVKNRSHAQLNACAAERMPLSVESVLQDRPVLWPLTRSMCGGLCDGAAAAVLVSPAFARSRGVANPVEVAASVVLSGRPSRAADEPSVLARAGQKAYEMAGIGPQAIALAEVHDPTSPQELLDLEELALTPLGQAWRWLQRGDLALGGRLPINVSGGLVSRGHPVGATGVAQIVEISRQLQGRSGHSQVTGAQVGLAQMSGGLLGQESAVATVHILVS